ncbi:MAG: hypothetical protein AB7G11_06365 [Phycisphaerales bacterium]
MLDGSGRAIPLNKILPEYGDGDGDAPGAVHRTQLPPTHHTLDGIVGSDIP